MQNFSALGGTRTPRTKLTKEVQELKGVIKEQGKEIAKLKEENMALREMLNKNSGNSSKSPTSDGFKKIHNSRVKSCKKPGGQIVHKGQPPKYYANPPKIIELKAKKCRCGGKVHYSEESYTKKQFAELEIKTNVIEYREYTGVCECCGRSVANRSPLKD